MNISRDLAKLELEHARLDFEQRKYDGVPPSNEGESPAAPPQTSEQEPVHAGLNGEESLKEPETIKKELNALDRPAGPVRRRGLRSPLKRNETNNQES